MLIKLNMKKVVLTVFYFLAALLYAQSGDAYQVLYDKTTRETTREDFSESLKVADSLYRKSGTLLLKAKSLMLSAQLYQRSGDIGKGIEYALKAEEVIAPTNIFEWKARVYIFLASQYRILKLYNHSKKYMNKAFNNIRKLKDEKVKGYINGILWQEIAYSNIEQKNYRKSIESVLKSEAFFNEAMYDDAFIEANNEQILGMNYYLLGDLDSALLHYRKAKYILESMPDYCLKGLVYDGFAKIYLDKNNLIKTKKYMDLAYEIAEKSNSLQLRNEVYHTFSMYYTAVHDLEGLAGIQEKKDSINEIMDNRSTLFINDFYQKMDKKNNMLQQKNHIKNWIIIGICLALAGNIIYFTHYQENFKITFNRFKYLLIKSVPEKIRLKEAYTVSSKVEGIIKIQNNEEDNNDAGIIMTNATEQKLLLRLNEFENSTLFTKKNISLSYLATYCGANTRYISYIINTYKKKDFNNYINELRIKYIVLKLEKIPQYRKYKVATLAEEAGFSSPNKFATVFKKEVSVSPSLYIKHLDDIESG
ncbi:AraC family transcriptional regulator [Elizabethkingia anophelis]|nr:AraC family transcriptional regulator [Elizabethkingia anophelis]MDV3861819.1 AraC family transcriptional regulator [Elizabethkingia anophelis]MDV3909093.1 AraC family transcriptional regulator [Elizabethkingia anophelis]MDV3924903.1 AraC family transcriptional regulator [Elizabethkingia anophelis]MDV3988228.1 AraC family transcriptional regulator [Elizabethkingia anophelis]